MFILKKDEVGGKRDKIARLLLHRVISSSATTLPWRYIGDRDINFHLVQVSALDKGGWSISSFAFGQRALIFCGTEGWMGPRVGMDMVAKRKIIAPCSSIPSVVTDSPAHEVNWQYGILHNQQVNDLYRLHSMSR
jgi:hypothetical protein